MATTTIRPHSKNLLLGALYLLLISDWGEFPTGHNFAPLIKEINFMTEANFRPVGISAPRGRKTLILLWGRISDRSEIRRSGGKNVGDFFSRQRQCTGKWMHLSCGVIEES